MDSPVSAHVPSHFKRRLLDIYTAFSEKHASETTLKMEAAGCYKLSVHIHHSTQHDVPVNSYLHFVLPDNLS
jgi:hypothetical protein